MKKITQIFSRLKSKKAFNWMPKLFLLVLMFSQMSWGQQVFGQFPIANGGFEGATYSASTTTTLSSTKWTTANSLITVAVSTPAATYIRSGNNCLVVTNNNANTKYVYTPTLGLTASTAYTVQYYIKQTGDLGSLDPQINGSAGSPLNITPAYATGTWSKVVYTKTIAATVPVDPLKDGAGFRSKASTTSPATLTTGYIDDFVVYVGALDTTPATATTSVNVTGSANSQKIDWLPAAGGVDGGGYVVVRFPSGAATTTNPNSNGIYAVNNTVFYDATNHIADAANDGTVLFITAAAVTYTDNAATSGCFYKVYTVDKAFNYSAAVTGKISASSPTISTTGTLGAVNTTYGTASATPTTFSVLGQDMTEGILVTAPAGYEVSLSSGSGYGATVLVPGLGTVASPVYVRLAATTPLGAYSGDIVLSSASATDVNIATVLSTVSKATPTVSVKPTASSIIYGQTLASSTLSGGTASVAGTFAFTTPSTAPNVGAANQSVTFTPTDLVNYTTAITTVSVTVTPAPTTWTTSWSNGTPDSTLEAIIDGTYSTTSNGAFAAKKLTVTSLGSLTVNSLTNLTVSNEVINNGSLVIENNANLIQTNNVANTGNAVVNKNSNPLYRLDYTMWSSPVTNAAMYLTDFSPLTSNVSPDNIRFYNYDPSVNKYAAITTASSTPFALGTGFLIRMPNTWADYPAGPATSWTGSFTGVPNNGNVNVAGTAGQFVAVGNPYPSTISADAFIDANSAGLGSGTLYFWRKTNGIGGTAYATYTKAGPVGVPAGSGTANGGFTPGADIAVGQGFITTVPTSGTIAFTNALRTSSTTAQFLRTKVPAQKDRVWINLSAGTNPVNQMLVAYMDGATTGVDAGIDGKYINDAATALTSNIDGTEYTIQGRPAFNDTDVVALNFKTEVAGTFTITKDHADGVFATGQDIYLVDTTTGTETNLQTDAYTFAAAEGTSNSRFKLTYKTSAALNVNAVAFDENSIAVYKQNGVLNINAGKTTIKSVKVFDLAGRLIFEQKAVNASTTTLKNLVAGKQALLIQITSDDNKVVTKKAIN